jgi:hypothetical protein
LNLKEFDPDEKVYTGREMSVNVTYILDLGNGYVIMSDDSARAFMQHNCNPTRPPVNHIQYIAPLGASEYAAALVLSLLYAAVCIVCAIGESEISRYNIVANRKIRR